MQESTLHAQLKSIYQGSRGLTEIDFDGYFIDAINDGVLYEIQTKGFYRLRDKLTHLLKDNSVTIVHPIAKNKWIIKVDHKTGEVLSRRLSPKKQTVLSVFDELIYIPEFLNNQNLSIEVLVTHIEEIRMNDGKGSWRRSGWSIKDRRLVDLKHIKKLTRDGYALILPDSLPEYFTSKDLAIQLYINRKSAQKILYTLYNASFINRHGKSGTSFLYSRK
jgi:hypothetical protein